jgi:glycosyltransferase involved in cell wall biosynthesis
MVNVSIILPVYNEIRFIQKTLESVVGEADEIIISDNASTDGTSDICQSFANKHPEIKYTRQKENSGSSRNHLYCINQASGKYIRNMGAHDMISIGSNQSMSLLLDKYPDVVMAYPKYIIGLNADYSFKYFHAFEESKNNLLSESAFIRAKSTIVDINEWSIFYGLWRTEMFRKIVQPRIFQSSCTDHTILFLSATKGKMLADEKSIFFRMNPHSDITFEDDRNRINKAVFMSKNINLYSWNFAAIAEQYDLALETFGENSDFPKDIFDLLVSVFFWEKADNNLTLDNMPPIILGKEEFCKKLIATLQEINDKKMEPQEEKVSKIIFNGIKKCIKYILPYGFYLFMHNKNKQKENK